MSNDSILADVDFNDRYVYMSFTPHRHSSEEKDVEGMLGLDLDHLARFVFIMFRFVLYILS